MNSKQVREPQMDVAQYEKDTLAARVEAIARAQAEVVHAQAEANEPSLQLPGLLTYISDINSIITRIEEVLGPILLADQPARESPQGQEECELKGSLRCILERLCLLVKRIDV